MKTQSLLFTAAAICLGAASAFGAVSSNIVGYVNKSITPGLSLIANQLDNKAGNKLPDVLPTLPDGATVFKFNGSGYNSVGYFGGYDAGADAITLNPGEGAFVYVDTATTLTFVGEVKQGNLSTPLANGLTVAASQVPQAGSIETLGFVPHDGDTVYQFAGGNFNAISYFGGWDGGAAPSLAIGESVFILTDSVRSWDRSFTVAP